MPGVNSWYFSNDFVASAVDVNPHPCLRNVKGPSFVVLNLVAARASGGSRYLVA